LSEKLVLHACVREHSNVIGTAVVEIMMHAMSTAKVSVLELENFSL
jgi:hypothetical protein